MGMEIKGPGQAPKQAPIRGPGQPQVSSGPTGAQALKNAEKAFDQTFFSGVPQSGASAVEGLLGAQVQADAVGVGAIKEQIIGLFTTLKSEFLKEKPAGRTADAFESESVVALAAPLEGKDLAETSQTLVSDIRSSEAELPRDVKQALNKLSDAFWSKKLEALSDTGHLQSMPAFAHFAKGPGARDLERMRPAFEAVMQEIYATVRKPGSGGNKSAGPPSEPLTTGDDTGPGDPPEAADAQVSAAGQSHVTAGPGLGANAQVQQNNAAVINLPADFGDKIAGILLKPNSPWFSGDIDALIQIVFMQCAKDAESDLRDMLNHMQQQMKLKQVKRDLLHRMKEDQVAIKKEAQKQLDALKSEGKIGPQVTIEEYMDQCKITYTPGTINEETHDISYTPPTLAPPDPLPNTWTGADPIADATKAVTAAENEKKCNEAAKQSAMDKAFKEIDEKPNLTDQQKNEQKCEAAQQVTNEWNPKIQASNNKIADAQDDLATAMNPPPPAPPSPDELSFAQFGVEVDRVKDDLDSLSAQTELDQMRMQIYMDRRAKAYEACSTAIKKMSDTLGSIIKNMS